MNPARRPPLALADDRADPPHRSRPGRVPAPRTSRWRRRLTSSLRSLASGPRLSWTIAVGDMPALSQSDAATTDGSSGTPDARQEGRPRDPIAERVRAISAATQDTSPSGPSSSPRTAASREERRREPPWFARTSAVTIAKRPGPCRWSTARSTGWAVRPRQHPTAGSRTKANNPSRPSHRPQHRQRGLRRPEALRHLVVQPRPARIARFVQSEGM
jgi:hypothetical protein